MADNYLEKRQQELAEKRPKVVHNHPSLDSLLKRNRSYRGYDTSRPVTEADLLKMLEAVPWVASGMNAQPLRFRLVTGADTARVHPLVKLGAALPQEQLPHPGEEPSAYIVVCSTVPENRVVDMDLGIAAPLQLPLQPLAVIGIGKPSERIFLVPVKEGAPLAYYRKDGAHFVPKLQVEDLLLNQ